MEAPENIYLFENPIDNTPDDRQLSKRSCDDDVEYIRKDASNEKACKFIKERLFFENSWHIEGETSILDKVIEDFRKYMNDNDV